VTGRFDNPKPEHLTIGVISDTHGLPRPEALEALRGSDYLIHAGDVGDPDVAPVTAVRGNIDRGDWARSLPKTDVLEAGGVSIYIVHILADLDIKPEAAGFAAVVYGHSHVPKQESRNGVLYFNPGSAGPRCFKLPSVGRLLVQDGKIRGEIIPLLTRKS